MHERSLQVRTRPVLAGTRSSDSVSVIDKVHLNILCIYIRVRNA
jgi:hypothetical protein